MPIRFAALAALCTCLVAGCAKSPCPYEQTFVDRAFDTVRGAGPAPSTAPGERLCPLGGDCPYS